MDGHPADAQPPRVRLGAEESLAAAPHACVEAGEGWAQVTLHGGSAGAWGPSARTAARLLQGLYGAGLPAAVLEYAPGTPPPARAAMRGALEAVLAAPAPGFAAPSATVLAGGRETPAAAAEGGPPGGEAAAIAARVRAHGERYGACPDFADKRGGAQKRCGRYVASVHGAPLAPPLLAQVCGLLAARPE